MALTQRDRDQIEKKAKEEGYKWNSSGDKMINGNGSFLKPSETGKSVNLNGTVYTDGHNAKNSRGW